MPKVSIDTSLNTVQVVKSGNDLQKTMDKLGRSIEKTFDGRKASGLGDALKPLTQELAKIMTQAGDTAAQIKALEKTIVAAENTRGKLAESLGKAKTEAEQTAAELEKTYANADKAAYALEKVNSEIHAAHDKGQLPSDTALLKRNSLRRLTPKLRSWKPSWSSKTAQRPKLLPSLKASGSRWRE